MLKSSTPSLDGALILSYNMFTGWWLTYPSETHEFVSCDDYSQYMDK